MKPKQLRFSAPDCIAEVLSETTEAIDRGVKLEDHAACGVREYWIVAAETQVVEQYLLEGDIYKLAVKTGDGPLKSSALPGVVIPACAIFDPAGRQQTLRHLIG